MPWNGSGVANATDGTFTGKAIWTAEKNATNLVTAAHFDTYTADILSMLQNCVLADGQAVAAKINLALTTSAANGVFQMGSAAIFHSYGGVTNLYFGTGSGNFSGAALNNTAFGYQTLVGVTAASSDNTAVGYKACNAVTNGINNVGIGSNSLVAVTTGIGNTMLGTSAGNNVTTGSTNICLGSGTQVPSATTDGQVNLFGTIFATGANTYSGSTPGTAKIGINNNAPTYELECGTGNFGIKTAGMGLRVKEGSNAKQGTATLSGGTVVVSNTSVTSNSRIILTAQDNNSTGALRVSARTASTSFTITSSNAGDSGVVAYQIFEPY